MFRKSRRTTGRKYLPLGRIAALTALLICYAPRAEAQSTALAMNGTLPSAAVGQSYLQSLRVGGAVGRVVFAASGTLPQGMAWVLSGSNPLLNGTPSTVGSFPLALTATDSIGQSASWTGTLTVTYSVHANDGPASPTVYLDEVGVGVDQTSITIGLSISPLTIPTGTSGTAYTGVTFTSPGGGNAVDFTESGFLPRGMTATPGTNDLVLAGTPIQSGSFPFTINVADHAGHTGSQAYTLVIAPGPAVVISPASIASSVGQGQNYGPIFFSASGGASALTLSESGALPTGITLSYNSGELELFGYPTQLGAFPFTIYATDQAGFSTSQAYSVTVTAPPPVAVSPATIMGSMNVGSAFPSTQFQIVGGSGDGTVAMTSGSLPPGMTFACVLVTCPGAIAILSGTPTTPGSYTFTVTATDTKLANKTASQSYTITVVLPHYDVTPGSFATALSGQRYSSGFSIVGNPAGYTLTMTNIAALPAGLTYAASGETVLVSGTPPSVTKFTSYGPFSLNLTDQYGNVETLGPIGLSEEPAPVAVITPSTSPAPPLSIDQVTLSFAATGNYGSAPSGRIIATLDGAANPLYLTLANGSTSIGLGILTPGTHTLVYSYSGDSVYPGTGSVLAGQPAVSTVTYTFTVLVASATLTPASLNFPASTPGQPSPLGFQTFTLTNTGTAALSNIANVTGPGTSSFSTQSNTCNGTLAAGANCSVGLLFNPVAQGSFNATLIITSISGSATLTQTAALSGTGLAPPTLTATPSPVRFPVTTVNTQATAITVTLANGGTGTLALNGTTLGSLGGADAGNFSVLGSSCSYSLYSGNTCGVSFTFTPNAARTFNATYTITSSDPASPTVIALTGTGTVSPSTAAYVFVVNSAGSVSSLARDGSPAQSSAVAGGGIGAAVDRNETLFSITADGSGISSFSPGGTLLNTTPGVLTGGAALAIDGNNQLWIAASGGVAVQPILGQGTLSVSDPVLLTPSGIAIDISGNVWVTDSGSSTVHEVVGGAAPVLPLANAVKNNALGARP